MNLETTKKLFAKTVFDNLNMAKHLVYEMIKDEYECVKSLDDIDGSKLTIVSTYTNTYLTYDLSLEDGIAKIVVSINY